MLVIIVEGPDGAGKSSLVSKLHHDLGNPVHERACTSEGGPVKELAQWVNSDLLAWRRRDVPVSIYDRHPVISEFIYGPIVRGEFTDPEMSNIYMRRQVKMVATRSFTVFCLPPLATVIQNLGDNEHMGGVAEHIREIYAGYQAMAIHWSGQSIVYDYKRDSYEMLLSLIHPRVNHLAMLWKEMR